MGLENGKGYIVLFHVEHFDSSSFDTFSRFARKHSGFLILLIENKIMFYVEHYFLMWIYPPE